MIYFLNFEIVFEIENSKILEFTTISCGRKRYYTTSKKGLQQALFIAIF
jgi:hypothetical protein